MEEMLTPVRTSECKNCGQKITLYMSDVRLEPYGWTHDDEGERGCHDSPVAEPSYIEDLSGLQQMLMERAAEMHKRYPHLKNTLTEAVDG